jgi:nucleoside 2-deoxyribosyltransferase
MPKPFIFVLMPFDPSFDDTYKLGIKETCESLDAYCERLDEQIFEENMLDRIYNQINKADIIISDLSGKNANVFYETGYAHALNKKVILLTSSVDDIPFDLKHRSHIIYNKAKRVIATPILNHKIKR